MGCFSISLLLLLAGVLGYMSFVSYDAGSILIHCWSSVVYYAGKCC